MTTSTYFCTSCGEPQAELGQFCTSCGEPIDAQVGAAPASAPAGATMRLPDSTPIKPPVATVAVPASALPPTERVTA